MTRQSISKTAGALADLYEKPFGGKPSGRYRISSKMLRKIAERQRLSEAFIQELTEEMFELGFILLNMELYYAVASIRTFSGYRRLGEASLKTINAHGERLQ